MTESVFHINAGGTIVSEAYGDPKHPPTFVKPLPLEESGKIVEAAIKKLRVDKRVDGCSFQRFNKDSKHFTGDDIESLAGIIQNADQQQVLITMGTDSMVQNAKKLKAKLAELGATDKTVLITGAVVPLSMEGKHKSDAPLNLAHAFLIFDGVDSGVYVVGRDAGTKRMGHFDPDEVSKDREVSLQDLQLTWTRGR